MAESTAQKFHDVFWVRLRISPFHMGQVVAGIWTPIEIETRTRIRQGLCFSAPDI
jgi:hypothetical protein